MRFKNKSKKGSIRSDIQKRRLLKQPKVKKIKTDTPPIYKLRLQREAFLTMVRATIEQKPDYIEELIHNWWKNTFPETMFPKEGGTLQQLSNAIQYGLMKQAYDKEEIIPSENFLSNYKRAVNLVTCKEPVEENMLDRCESYNQLSKIFIKGVNTMRFDKKKKTEEESVAVAKTNGNGNGKKKDSKKKKTKEPIVTPVHTDSKKKAKKVDKKEAVKKSSNGKCQKGLRTERLFFAAQLVAADKYTDEKIAEMTNAKFANKIDHVMKAAEVGSLRYCINKGIRDGYGVKKPKTPYKRIKNNSAGNTEKKAAKKKK